MVQPPKDIPLLDDAVRKIEAPHSRLALSEAELRSLMRHRMLVLHAAITDLNCLYEAYPDCNSLFEINNLILMSLDEWDIAVGEWLEWFDGEI